MTIHFHGTPITPNAEILAMAGAHFCVSHWRPDQDRLCHEIGQSVLLDNGAFSAWQEGTAIDDWRPYYDWCDRWLDYATTISIIPDVITGSVEQQDELLRQWPHGRERGMPVWHMHEPIDRLLMLLDTYPRVCIGSSAEYAVINSPAWCRRMDEVFRAIVRHNQRTPYIHMLRGMLLIAMRWPFASVDSTNIGRNLNRLGDRSEDPLFGIAGEDGARGAKMRAKLDARQCPPRFICRGEQPELAA